jgi:heme/copper-type cytochrome/quinol oxidase subunit 4
METSTLTMKGCKSSAYAWLFGLLNSGDLYRATPAATQGLGFSGLIRRIAPFSSLLRHTRGCEGSILTRILGVVHVFVLVEGVKIRLQKIWTIFSMIIDIEILIRIYYFMFITESKTRFCFRLFDCFCCCFFLLFFCLFVCLITLKI